MIIHVDMSNRYYQKSYSVIACVNVNQYNKKDYEFKKAVVIKDPIRKNLLTKYSHTKLHAALIILLIENCNNVKKIIVCSDVNPVDKVMSCMQDLKPSMFGRLKSLEELREEVGDKSIRSAANSFARNINRNYPKRKNEHRIKHFFKDGSVILIENQDSKYYPNVIKYLEKLKK